MHVALLRVGFRASLFPLQIFLALTVARVHLAGATWPEAFRYCLFLSFLFQIYIGILYMCCLLWQYRLVNLKAKFYQGLTNEITDISAVYTRIKKQLYATRDSLRSTALKKELKEVAEQYNRTTQACNHAYTDYNRVYEELPSFRTILYDVLLLILVPFLGAGFVTLRILVFFLMSFRQMPYILEARRPEHIKFVAGPVLEPSPIEERFRAMAGMPNQQEKVDVKEKEPAEPQLEARRKNRGHHRRHRVKKYYYAVDGEGKTHRVTEDDAEFDENIYKQHMREYDEQEYEYGDEQYEQYEQSEPEQEEEYSGYSDDELEFREYHHGMDYKEFAAYERDHPYEARHRREWRKQYKQKKLEAKRKKPVEQVTIATQTQAEPEAMVIADGQPSVVFDEPHKFVFKKRNVVKPVEECLHLEHPPVSIPPVLVVINEKGEAISHAVNIAGGVVLNAHAFKYGAVGVVTPNETEYKFPATARKWKIAEDLVYMALTVNAPTLSLPTLRPPIDGEKVIIVDEVNQKVSNGNFTAPTTVNYSSTYGTCGAPVRATQDDKVIGFHTADGTIVPVTAQMLEFFRSNKNNNNLFPAFITASKSASSDRSQTTTTTTVSAVSANGRATGTAATTV